MLWKDFILICFVGGFYIYMGATVAKYGIEVLAQLTDYVIKAINKKINGGNQ